MTKPRALRLDDFGQRHHRHRRNPCRGRTDRERHSPRADPKGSQDGGRCALTRGAPIRKFGQIIGFASRPIARRRVGSRAQLRGEGIRARLPFRRGRAPRGHIASRRSADIRGVSAAEWQGRDAQLYRDPHFGELLGDRRAPDRKGSRTFGNSRRLSRHRRNHRAGAWHGMRDRREGRGLRRLDANPMGLCRESQHRRDVDGRSWLRSVPDRPHEGGVRRRRGRGVPKPHNSGDGRHAEDGRSWRRARQGDAAFARSGAKDAGAGERTHARASMRRVGRLFGDHRQSRAGRRGGHSRAQRRHGDPLGDA